jgi:thiol-disulfide isomerase/thioredoxin
MNEVHGDPTAVIAFTASWCEPCKQLKPQLVQASTVTERNIYVVDIELADPKLTERYSVRSVPTVIAYSGEDSWVHITSRRKDDILAELGE